MRGLDCRWLYSVFVSDETLRLAFLLELIRVSQSSPSLNADTLAFLAEVKKGKLRRFVMIAKGSSIVSLIVYKKGSVEKLKKEAKEGGKGQFYFGVAEGSGAALGFKLAVDDGFTDAPVKNAVLKSFLADAGFVCKPEFVIVPTLPAITDEDELDPTLESPQSNAGTPTPEPTSGKSEGSQSEASDVSDSGSDASDAEYRASLTQLSNKLAPVIKQVLAFAPEKKEELLRPIAAVRAVLATNQISQEQYETAKKSLLPVGLLVKQLLSSRPGGSGPSESDSASATAGATKSPATQQPEGESGSTETEEELDSSLKEWQLLRSKVVDNLKRLASQVAATKAPSAAGAINEIKAILGNLPDKPKIESFASTIIFLNSNAAVDDICRFAFDFRSPLIEQLNSLSLTD